MLPVMLCPVLPQAPQELLFCCVCTSEKVLIQTLKLVLQMIKLKLLLQLLLLSSHTRRRDHCFLLEKAWCLVGVCVVPTPAFSIKTSRKRDHLKVKIRNPFTALFIVSLIHIIICTQIHVILNLLHRCRSKKQMHKFIFCDTQFEF